MQRRLKIILAILGLLLFVSCAAKDDAYFQTYRDLDLFDLEHYETLSEDDRLNYIKISLKTYSTKSAAPMLEWGFPMAWGPVDRKLYSDFIVFPEDQNVIFFSQGGEDIYSEKIANLILEKKISLIVAHVCVSACAEDIIPAADTLYFFDEPIIAYHGNAQNALFHIKSGDHPDPCPRLMSKTRLLEQYKDTVDKKIKRYRKTGHNIEFWKEQEKRLKGFSFAHKIKADNHCVRTPSYENAEYWLPTSAELKALLGLKFKGTVCADDEDCYRKKLLLFFGPGVRFYIDGKIYTT